MPITPDRRALYPREWPLISLWVRVCAGWRCEWCDAQQGEPHPATGSRVVLTVAHLDHTPANCDLSNLRALCQMCHNRYDAPFRQRNRAARRREAFAAGWMGRR